MTKNEMSTKAGADLSPAEEVRQAVSGFVSDFNGFRAEINSKLQQSEERIAMMDRKMTLPARSPLGARLTMMRRIKRRSTPICATGMTMGSVGWNWTANRCRQR